MSFPSTPILDNFNRPNEGPPPTGWGASGVFGTPSSVEIVSDQLVDNGTQTGGWWATPVGPDTEVYATLAALPLDGDTADFFMRLVNPGGGPVDGYRVRVIRADANPGYNLGFYRIDNNVSTLLGSLVTDTSGALAAGVKFGASIVGATLTAYINKAGSWSSIATRTDGTYGSAGYIGVVTSAAVTTAIAWDDFGGGAPPVATFLPPRSVSHQLGM